MAATTLDLARSTTESFREAGAPPSFPATGAHCSLRPLGGSRLQPTSHTRVGHNHPQNTVLTPHVRERVRKGVPQAYNFGEHVVRHVSLLLVCLTLAVLC